MSSTGRGATRVEADFYPTPAWCVRRLLERLELPGGRWLEPAGGDGAIVRAVDRADVQWSAVDIRAEAVSALRRLGVQAHLGSFPRLVESGALDLSTFDVVITNPPFSEAAAFLDAAMAPGRMKLGAPFVMLVRIAWLAGEERAERHQRRMPNVYVLPNRPSFTGAGTDSADYVWAVWHGGVTGMHGTIEVLECTPLVERIAGALPAPLQASLF